VQSLVKKYTRHNVSEIKGPITVVTGKLRRVTFYECPNDINAMIDLAKIADLVMLTVDGSFGFEMETFEFLNILQTHGFPKVMGVLTHLDGFRDGKKLQRTKKVSGFAIVMKPLSNYVGLICLCGDRSRMLHVIRFVFSAQELKHRFWAEIHEGAKLFYLSGVSHGSYPKTEVHNLALYISRMKFRPLIWRNTHPFVLADRLEDMTNPAEVTADPLCDRRIALFGFIRGTNMKSSTPIHIPGAGDFQLSSVSALPDPIPLPEADPEKRKVRRSLNAKETLLYAPMSNIGALLYDKDAMYINLPHAHFTREDLVSSAQR
jgi:ribosome biogenesis protein BMS1